MKARIPLPNDLKSAVKTEIAAEWKKIQKEKALGMYRSVYRDCLDIARTLRERGGEAA